MIFIKCADEIRRCQSCKASGLDANVKDIHIGLHENATSCTALCERCRKILADKILNEKS